MQLANRLIKPVFAQKPLGKVGGDPGTGLGPFSNAHSYDIDVAGFALSTIISTVIGVITVVAGIWFIFNLVIAAIGILVSGGSEEAIKNNTKKLTQSLLGLVMVIGAIALMSLIGLILGINFLNVEGLISQLSFLN